MTIDTSRLTEKREFDEALQTVKALVLREKRNTPKRTIYHQRRMRQLHELLEAIHSIRIFDSTTGLNI